jgi:hypothetical protein
MTTLALLPPQFPLPLRLERTGPRLGVLRAPFAFLSPTLGRIEVADGFDTDYASVPRIFWSIYPPDGSYTEAAIIHDALYFYQARSGIGGPLGGPDHLTLPITRAQADTVFLEAMAALGVPAVRRRILYSSVRAGGWLAWSRNTRWRAEEAAKAQAIEAELVAQE